MTPDFATAKKGDEGYWVVPTGQYGTFRCDTGDHACTWPSMSMFGMKTPAKTYVAIVTGLKYYFTAKVTARDGVYRQSCVLNEEQCTEPYEDFSIEWRTLTGRAMRTQRHGARLPHVPVDRGAVKPFNRAREGERRPHKTQSRRPKSASARPGSRCRARFREQVPEKRAGDQEGRW